MFNQINQNYLEIKKEQFEKELNNDKLASQEIKFDKRHKAKTRNN